MELKWKLSFHKMKMHNLHFNSIKLGGSLIETSFEHVSKAEVPILVAQSGIVTENKL